MRQELPVRRRDRTDRRPPVPWFTRLCCRLTSAYARFNVRLVTIDLLLPAGDLELGAMACWSSASVCVLLLPATRGRFCAWAGITLLRLAAAGTTRRIAAIPRSTAPCSGDERDGEGEQRLNLSAAKLDAVPRRAD